MRVCVMVPAVCFALAVSGPASAQDAVTTLRLVESLKIAGAKEDLSASIPRVAVLSERRMAVFNQPTAQFVFFDSTGRRLGAFGARGAGPGEFGGAGGSSILAPQAGSLGSEMWVYDQSQRRFTRISHQRRLVATMLVPRHDASAIALFAPQALIERSRMIVRIVSGTSTKYTNTGGREATRWKRTDSAIVVVDSDGRVERRLVTLPAHDTQVPDEIAGQSGSFRVPFAHQPLSDVAVVGDRVALVTFNPTSVTGGTFRVTVVGVAGDTLVNRTHPFTSAAVTKDAIDSALKPLEEGRPRIGGGEIKATAEELKYLRDRIPAVRVPFERVVLGIDGTVWLLRARGPRGAPREYTVLAPNGDILGNVSLPRVGMTFQQASRDAVWLTARDDDGFTDVYRYRIETP